MALTLRELAQRKANRKGISVCLCVHRLGRKVPKLILYGRGIPLGYHGVEWFKPAPEFDKGADDRISAELGWPVE